METVAQLSTGHNDLQMIIKILGYQKMCCHWVPLLLTNEYKRACMDVLSHLLQQHAATAAYSSLCRTGRNSWLVVGVLWISDRTPSVIQDGICFCTRTLALTEDNVLMPFTAAYVYLPPIKMGYTTKNNMIQMITAANIDDFLF
jgi:hypothetical protein